VAESLKSGDEVRIPSGQLQNRHAAGRIAPPIS
jgi:hypothetical protein